MVGKIAKVIGSIIISLIVIGIPVIFGMVLMLPEEYSFFKVLLGIFVVGYVADISIDIYFKEE